MNNMKKFIEKLKLKYINWIKSHLRLDNITIKD